MPKKNLGLFGRLIRLAISIFLFYYAYEHKSWVALGLAIFTLYEAVASWCVLYQLFGINHCPVGRRPPKN